MSATAALQILLSAKDEASPVLEKTSGKLKGLGSAAGTAFGIIGGAAGGAAVGMLADMARAAAADEVGMVALKTAVENSGVSWEDNSAAIEERIKKGQALAFSDDAVRASIAQLTTATGDAGKALDMQGLVMDIARGRNISLGAATDIAQKAALGQFGALKKIGIVLAEGSTATEALGALQERYAKQADNYGSTTQAALFRVNDAIGEWKESIGAALGPAQGMIAMLPGLQSGMVGAGAAIGGVSKLINLSFIPSLVAMAIPFAPVILVVGAVALAIGLLALAWSNNLGDIQGKTQAVLGFVTGLWDTFSSFFRGLWEGLGGPVSAAIALITAPISGLIGLAQSAIAWIAQVTGAKVPTPGPSSVAGAPTTTDLTGVHSNAGQAGLGGWDIPASQFAGGVAPDWVNDIPMFSHGGVMPWTGLAHLEKGERVLTPGQSAGVTVNINGPVYGVLDFEQKIKQVVRDNFPRALRTA